MHSADFLLQDTRGLETEIERHCAGLGLDFNDVYQVKRFTHDMLQNMDALKEAAHHGDRTARAKVEIFGMVLMLHDANIKAFGANYMTRIDELAKAESAWIAFARAMWNELESREVKDN